MDGLVILLVVVGVASVIGLLATAFGVDSRDGIGDDWARSAS
jgi:hypothetical protein